MTRNALEKHLKYKDRTMSQLISERTVRLSIGQNELRRKWLPEKYNPNLSTKKPL